MSGKAWPAALRRELGVTDDSTVSKTRDGGDDDSIHQCPALSSSLSTSQLRQFIHQSYATISSLQRQIHRGEESYFEESNAHGNLYSGWDNIWIEENHENDKAQKSAPMKKMPNDYRWFSSSCAVNPRGNGKVDAVLARESLMEPPLTSNKASSGRVLKRASPLKVSSSSSQKISGVNDEINVNETLEPEIKKTKHDTKPDATISAAAAMKADETLLPTTVPSIQTAFEEDPELSISKYVKDT